MANQDAWAAGVDIAQGKSSRKKKGDDDDAASLSTKSDTSSKPVGGLLGLASKGVSKIASKMRGGKASGASGAHPASGLENQLVSYKHGGRVRKTGLALLHRGEFVIPAGKHRVRKPSLRKTLSKV